MQHSQHEAANWAQELKGNRAVNEFWGTAVAPGMHLTTAAGEGRSSSSNSLDALTFVLDLKPICISALSSSTQCPR